MILWAAMALASEAVLLTLDGTAEEVSILPSREPGVVEVLVAGARVSVDPFIMAPEEDRYAGWIDRGEVVDLGGSSLVRMWLERPTSAVAIGWSEAGWEIEPGAAAAQAACGTAPRSPFWALRGSDGARKAAAPTLTELPRWVEAEPAVADWEILKVREGRQSAEKRYTFGAIYRDRGHDREAAWYFARAVEAGGPPAAALQLAAARLRLGDAEGARRAAELTERAGGAPVDAAEIRVRAALLEGLLDPAPAHELLGGPDRVAPDPHQAMIAGMLLLQCGCDDEAARVLTWAQDELPGEGVIPLVDALVLTGQVNAAAQALADTPSTHGSSVDRRVRELLVGALTSEPERWGVVEPLLALLPSDDAAFIGARIAWLRGDDAAAARLVARLLDERGELARGDVGVIFARAWEAGVAARFATSPLNALTFHSEVWRPSSEFALRTTDTLATLADAWMTLGAPEEALELRTIAAGIEGREFLDGTESVLAIAEAYLAAGRYEEALESFAWLDTHPGKADPAARALLRGRVYAALGDTVRARAAWAGVRAPPAAVDEAALRIALADANAGACGLLERRPWTTLPDDIGPGVVLLGQLRCADRARDDARAVALARQSLDVITDPATLAWVRRRAGVPATGVDVWQALEGTTATVDALTTRARGG